MSTAVLTHHRSTLANSARGQGPRIGFALVTLVSLFALPASRAAAQATCYFSCPSGTICFPQGPMSFADVVLYSDPDPGWNCPPTNPAFQDPSVALGAPNWSSSCSSTTGTGAYALGRGGILELGFVDNMLTNSGNSSADLHVFEVGASAENFYLGVRPADEATRQALIARGFPQGELHGYFKVTLSWFPGGTSSIDLDQWFTGFAAGALKFNAVQLYDDAQQEPVLCSSTTTAGADIDAVGAITTVECIHFVRGGVDDNYAGSTEPSTRSAALQASLTMEPLNFDNVPSSDGQLAQTYAGLPAQMGVAMLMLDLKAGGSLWDPFASLDDRIRIGFAGTGGFVERWVARIGEWGQEWGGLPGLVRGTWSSGREAVLGLDLRFLPLAGGGTLDLVGEMESHGFVDVIVEENTGADHIRLSFPHWPECPGVTLDAPSGPAITLGPSLAAYPVPARSQVNLRYTVAQASAARVRIFDAAGRRVAELDGRAGASSGEVVWDLRDGTGRRVSAGFYIARLEAGAERRSVHIVVSE